MPPRKRPAKLYRISDIVEYSGVSRQTIHNYTTMGLITEARRTGGGHRLFDESVFSRLDLIEDLKRSGRSLRDISGHCVKLDMST
jgi:DNA-binding transcriptional MerR regulator